MSAPVATITIFLSVAEAASEAEAEAASLSTLLLREEVVAAWERMAAAMALTAFSAFAARGAAGMSGPSRPDAPWISGQFRRGLVRGLAAPLYTSGASNARESDWATLSSARGRVLRVMARESRRGLEGRESVYRV